LKDGTLREWIKNRHQLGPRNKRGPPSVLSERARCAMDDLILAVLRSCAVGQGMTLKESVQRVRQIIINLGEGEKLVDENLSTRGKQPGKISRQAIPGYRDTDENGNPSPFYNLNKNWPGTDYVQSPKCWSTKGTLLSLFQNVIIPHANVNKQTRRQHGQQVPEKYVVIMDNAPVHCKEDFLKEVHSLDNNLIILYMPAGMTGVLQPLDVAVNKSFFLKDKTTEMYDIRRADIERLDMSVQDAGPSKHVAAFQRRLSDVGFPDVAELEASSVNQTRRGRSKGQKSGEGEIQRAKKVAIECINAAWTKVSHETVRNGWKAAANEAWERCEGVDIQKYPGYLMIFTPKLQEHAA